MFGMDRFNAVSLLLVAFALSSFGGCGGGSGGGIATGTDTGAATTQAQPTKQIFVSDKVLEPAFSISSQGTNLYVGSQHGLIEIDSMTGAKRTVAGNQFYVDAWGGVGPQTWFPPAGLFDTASGSAFVPLYHSDAKMASVSLSPSFSVPEVVLPYRAMASPLNVNGRGVTASTTRGFWMGFDGNTTMHVFSQAFGQADTNKKIASVTAADGNMATYGDFLYLYTDELNTPTRMVFRYQISSGNLVSVPQARTSATYNLNFPLVAAPNGVYWAEGSNIYFLDNASNVAQQVGSVGGTVTQLALGGTNIYSLHGEYYATVPPTSNIVVTRFDTLTGTTTEVVRRTGAYVQGAKIAGTEAGRIFFSTDGGGSVSVSEITAPNTLSQVVNLPAYGLTGMYASPTVLAIAAMPMGTTNPQIYRYNFSSAATDVIYVGTSVLQGWGESLFIGASEGLAKLQLNMPINIPTALQPSPTVNSSWTQGGTSSGGYFYWVGAQFPATGPVYQLETSMPNGSNFAVLLQTSGELRDPIVFNGRVYFLCKDSCGAAGWVIGSTTLAGTGQQIELLVGGVNPRLYQYNGHGYLVASDGLTSSIVALDMNTGAWSTMVSQLPYSALYLDFSTRWLYWSGETVNVNGTPAREVARQAWIDWNHVSAKQQIEWGSGVGVVDDLRVGTIHYFSGNLYYWNQGLVRVPE